MKTLQQNSKVSLQKEQNYHNSKNPTTPYINKTRCFPSPQISVSKSQQKVRNHNLFLSPTNLIVFNSPKSPQQQQKTLHNSQHPNIQASRFTGIKQNDNTNKNLIANLSKKETFSIYVPMSNLKKKSSPNPLKTSESLKIPKQPLKEVKNLPISSTTIAMRMNPDESFTERTQSQEINNHRLEMGSGDEERDPKGQLIITKTNIGEYKIDAVKKLEVNLEKERKLELDLSPISRKKDDLSSFLSEKEKTSCMKHPKKKAKYRVVRENTKDFDFMEELFCSECAINLAMRGIKLIKLPNCTSATRTNTETDEKLEENRQDLLERQYKTFIIEEFKVKADEVIEEISVLTHYFLDQKLNMQSQVNKTKNVINSCSENIIALFKEESEKAVEHLESGLNKESEKIDEFLDKLAWYGKECNNFKGELFQKTSLKNFEISFKEMLKERHDQINNFRDEISILKKPLQEVQKEPFEGRIQAYKISLKNVLKEVILELEKEEAISNISNINQKPSQDTYDEHLLKNLGAFEDFLRADESQDALEMKIIKGKNADNMVISFGNKEIFDNVLQSPTEALTLCSTQGETMVAPGFEDTAVVFRLKENRGGLTDFGKYESANSEDNHDNYENFFKFVEDKLKDQKYIEDSVQKPLVYSPEFKGMGETGNANGY